MAFESDDATLVADHVGAIPLSVALAASRGRGVPPSLEVCACIAVRVLDGAPAGNVASREVTIALNGSVRVASSNVAPTNVAAVAVILWEMFAGRPPTLLDAVLRNVTRYRSAFEMARAIERAVKPAPASAVGAWLEAACGRIAPARPRRSRSRVARVAPFAAAAVALFVGFGIAWVCAPRNALASIRVPHTLDDSVRSDVRLVGRVPIAAVPVESLPAPVVVASPRRPLAPSCDNPFRVDERGIRRVRRECL
jgi:hypothetical protein